MSSMRLTKSQEQCLELVAQGMTSKEIAQLTGLSPRSVDTYLTAAAAAMGAPNRRVAAQRFMQERGSQKSRSQSQGLAAHSDQKDAGCRIGMRVLLDTLFPIAIGGGVNSLSGSEKFLYSARVGVSGVVVVLAMARCLLGC